MNPLIHFHFPTLYLSLFWIFAQEKTLIRALSCSTYYQNCFPDYNSCAGNILSLLA